MVNEDRDPTGEAMASRLPTDFWRLWWASTLSNLGDGLRFVALPLLATTLTRSPVLVAGVNAFAILPWLVTGPISGAIVDRLDRRRILVAVQIVRGTAGALFAVAVSLGHVDVWMVYVIAAVVGVGETLADTAAQAAVPRLVAPSLLERANSRILAGQIATTRAIGAPLGGALFAVAAPLPFSIDAATYFVAACLIAIIARDLGPTGVEPGARTSVANEIADGLRWLWRDPLLRALATSVGVVNFGLQAFSAILVLFAIDVLHLSEAGFGVLLGAGAAGGLLGAVLADVAVRSIGRCRILIGAVSVVSVASLGIGLAPNAIAAGAAFAACMLAMAVFNVVAKSLRQAVTPSRFLGRVVTSFSFVSFAGIPVGAMAGGVLSQLTNLRAPFILGSALAVLAALMLNRTLSESAIVEAIANNPDLTPP